MSKIKLELTEDQRKHLLYLLGKDDGLLESIDSNRQDSIFKTKALAFNQRLREALSK